MSAIEQQAVKVEPVIGPEQKLPEITPKSIIVSIFLIILLAASNAYLGLKVGTTISAAIPAVVISMGLFRLFRKHNVLEINIVQSAASVGEGITAGLAFTLPALIIIGYWHSFHYWTMVWIGIFGGILGVLFSIPLRKALLNDKTLNFPEGTAIGQVMRVSASEDCSVKPIVYGSLIGGIIGLFQTGFGVLAQTAEYWFIQGKSLLGFGLGFSPAVIAAGYICGVTVGISILLGAIIGWFVGVPIISAHYGFGHAISIKASANHIWSYYIRDIGVGTMLVGGLWTLISLFKPVKHAVLSSFEVLHDMKHGHGHKIIRTEKDIPINYALWGIVFVIVAVAIQLFGLFSPSMLGISTNLHIGVIAVCAVFLLFAGFIFSSVSGYFAGLVGATNSPGSGLLVSFLLILSFILLMVINTQVDLSVHLKKALHAAGLAIIIGSFVGAALAMTTEAIQDAKSGQIIGGTPWKQQVVLLASVVVAALVLPLILILLFNAYGIGGVFPHPGMDTSQMLAAPQAGLMAAIVRGVFNHRLPWSMVIIGLVIGGICIVVDEILKIFFNKRLLVLGVGLGIYLPLSVSIPIFIGGLISYFVQKKVHARYGVIGEHGDVHVSKGMHDALFIACGLVAGSTLMGVILAIPFAITRNANVLHFMPVGMLPIAVLLSAIVTIAICFWIYKVAVKEHPQDQT